MRLARLALLIWLCGLPAVPATAQNVITVPPETAAPTPPQGAPTAGNGTPTAPAGPSYFGNPVLTPGSDLAYEADTVQSTSLDDSQFTLLGHVRVYYQGYILNADRADVDLNKGEALFSRSVVLLSPNGQTVRSTEYGTLRLNLRQGTYDVLGAVSVLPPDTINAVQDISLLLPVYVYGGAVNGSPSKVDAAATHFTTDIFQRRLGTHYSFGARQVYILPGRRLVARDVSLFKKDHRFFTIPYFFVPLDHRLQRQTLFPTVGETPDEGYFIKFAFGYALATSLPGILRLDLMTRKGIGTGFDQTYGSTAAPQKGSGTFTLYHLYDRQTGLTNLTGSLSHAQRFGTVNATLSSQFQQNSYYASAAESRALSTQLNLTRSVGNLTTSLLTNLSENNYGLGTSQTLTSSFNSAYAPTRKEQLLTQLNFSQFVSPSLLGVGGTDQRELESNVDYTQHENAFNLELLGTKYTTLGASTTGSGFAGGLERLPELRLSTDPTHLTALRSFLPNGAQVGLSLGDFNEPFSRTDTQRAYFSLDTGTVTKNINARNSFDYGGSFQQGFYGDDTAQYVLNGRTGYRLKIGSKSSAGVTYLYLKPYGYSPFQFDQIGNSNLAALSFAYQETSALKLAVASGYDFNQTRGVNGSSAAPWQNVAFQSLFAPGNIFRLQTTSSYDLNHNTLLDLTNNLRVRAPGNIALDLGTRFAPSQHKFSQINGDFDIPFLRDPNPEEDAGYRIRAIGGYNGYTDKFDYKGLALTRSWHDWEATLVYQDTPNGLRPGSSFMFNFRLKAFPAYEPFATGQYGQSLDTGLGQVF